MLSFLLLHVMCFDISRDNYKIEGDSPKKLRGQDSKQGVHRYSTTSMCASCMPFNIHNIRATCMYKDFDACLSISANTK